MVGYILRPVPAALRIALAAVVLAAPSVGQQAAPVQSGAAAAATSDFLDNFTWHPGGTREADMWQVLILFGIGDAEGES